MCLKQPLNTGICPFQINGLLCHGAPQFCLKASCIIEGIDAEGVYLGAKILPCCQSAIVCGSSELNFTASGCYAVNVSSTVGVCFSDSNQQQEGKTNETIGTFKLTVTSVINLASTYTRSRLSTSAPMGFDGTTPIASSSNQAHSHSPTFIIIGVIASVIALLIVILTTTVCVIMIIKQSKSWSSLLHG